MPEKTEEKPKTKEREEPTKESSESTEPTEPADEEELPEEEAPEEESPEEAEVGVEDVGGSLFTPEALIMLPLAVLFDGGELLVELIPGAGQILSIMIDIFAVLFFGFWMWFRSGIITVPKKTGVRIAKATKWAKRLKWMRPLFFIIELLPIVSSILPLWVLVVYFELKYNT